MRFWTPHSHEFALEGRIDSDLHPTQPADVAGYSGVEQGPNRPDEVVPRFEARPASRKLVTAAVLAIDMIVLVFTAGDIGGPVRVVTGLTASLAVPGWALVAHLRLDWPAAEVTLTLGASLAVLVLAAQGMLMTGTWHPEAATLAIGVGAALLLVAFLARHPRRSVTTGQLPK
jgi:uncharacterized membrane protein